MATIALHFAPALFFAPQPETITVRFPGAFLNSGRDVLASPSFVIEVAGANGLAVSGSLVSAGGADAGVGEDMLSAVEVLHNLTVSQPPSCCDTPGLLIFGGTPR